MGDAMDMSVAPPNWEVSMKSARLSRCLLPREPIPVREPASFDAANFGADGLATGVMAIL